MHLRSALVSLLAVLAALAPFRAGAQVLPTSRSPLSFDGTVHTTYRHENILYVGGRFRFVSPSANLARGFVDLSYGSATPRVAFPRLDAGGSVYAMVDDGSGGWFVGGDFTAVEGQTRQYLAHFLASGALDPAFAPAFSGAVWTLARAGNTLYVGGSFTTINGVTRNRAAAFDIAGLSILPWHPNVGTGTVHAIAVSGSRLFLGGTFVQVAATNRQNLAAVDAATGALQSFVANTTGQVYALHLSGTTLYVGGFFDAIGNVSKVNLAAVDAVTAAVKTFSANTDGTVWAIQSSPTRLFVGGTFDTVAGMARRNLAALNPATGAVTEWNPTPEAATLDTTAVFALAVAGDVVYVGGSFEHLGGEPRANIAAVPANGDGRSALSWNPGLSGLVRAITLTPSGAAAGGVFTHYGTRVRGGLAAYDLVTGSLLNLAPRIYGTGVDTVRGIAVIGDTLYFGGEFTLVNGAARIRTAAVNRHSGALLPWAADTNDTVFAMAAYGSDLYVAGEFTVIGGQARPGLALVDPITGTTLPFAPGLNANGDVLSLEIDGGTMYVGGNFTHLLFQPRARLGAIDLATRALTPFNPGVTGTRVTGLFVRGNDLFLSGLFTAVGGQARSNAAAVSRSTAVPTGFVPTTNGEVRDIAVLDGFAFLAGDFTLVNGVLRVLFASVDAATGANTTTFGPAPASNGTGAHLSVSSGLLIAGGEAVPLSGITQPTNLFVFAHNAMGGVPGPPSAPSLLAVGSELRARWSPSPIGGAPTGYLVEASAAPGAAPFATLPTGSSSPSFAFVGVPPGTYYLRLRATNAAGISVPSPEVGVAFGNPQCTAPPEAPDWAPEVLGSDVAIRWPDAIGQAAGYTLSAGSAAGLSNIGAFGLGAGPAFEAQAAPGVYYARLFAASACGTSAPSRDVPIMVGGVTPPLAPVVRTEVAGGTVTVSWSAVPGAAAYQLEAGSGPLLSNAAVVPTPATSLVAPGVPSGTYYVRVHAIAANGLRSTSAEAVVILP